MKTQNPTREAFRFAYRIARRVVKARNAAVAPENSILSALPWRLSYSALDATNTYDRLQFRIVVSADRHRSRITGKVRV